MNDMYGREFDKSEVLQILKEKAEYNEMSEKLERLSGEGYDIETKHQCIDGAFRSIRDLEEERKRGLKMKLRELIPVFTMSVMGRYGLGVSIGVIASSGVDDLSTFEFAMFCVLILLMISDWFFVIFSLWIGGKDE